jgi:hypothetical protein
MFITSFDSILQRSYGSDTASIIFPNLHTNTNRFFVLPFQPDFSTHSTQIMWSISTYVFGAILGLNILGAHALVVCNTQQARDSASVSGAAFAKDLKNTIAKPMDEICIAGFDPNDKHRFISYESGPLVFTITPTEDNTQIKNSCGVNFDQIIEECIVEKDLWGGSALIDGLLYQIYNHEMFGTGLNDGYINN